MPPIPSVAIRVRESTWKQYNKFDDSYNLNKKKVTN